MRWLCRGLSNTRIGMDCSRPGAYASGLFHLDSLREQVRHKYDTLWCYGRISEDMGVLFWIPLLNLPLPWSGFLSRVQLVWSGLGAGRLCRIMVNITSSVTSSCNSLTHIRHRKRERMNRLDLYRSIGTQKRNVEEKRGELDFERKPQRTIPAGSFYLPAYDQGTSSE